MYSCINVPCHQMGWEPLGDAITHPSLPDCPPNPSPPPPTHTPPSSEVLPVYSGALDAQQHPQVDGGPAGSRLAAVTAQLVAWQALDPLQETLPSSPDPPLPSLSGLAGRVDAAGGGWGSPVQTLGREDTGRQIKSLLRGDRSSDQVPPHTAEWGVCRIHGGWYERMTSYVSGIRDISAWLWKFAIPGNLWPHAQA